MIGQRPLSQGATYASAGGALGMVACLTMAGLTSSPWWIAGAGLVFLVALVAGLRAEAIAEAERRRRRRM
jgi:hypothetical protein